MQIFKHTNTPNAECITRAIDPKIKTLNTLIINN